MSVFLSPAPAYGTSCNGRNLSQSALPNQLQAMVFLALGRAVVVFQNKAWNRPHRFDPTRLLGERRLTAITFHGVLSNNCPLHYTPHIEKEGSYPLFIFHKAEQMAEQNSL
jgi:hypothetical protein